MPRRSPCLHHLKALELCALALMTVTFSGGCYLRHSPLETGDGEDAGAGAPDATVDEPLPVDVMLVRGIMRLTIQDGRTDAQLTFQAWTTNDSAEEYEIVFGRAAGRFSRAGRSVDGEGPISPSSIVASPGTEVRSVLGALFPVPEGGVITRCSDIIGLSVSATAELSVEGEHRTRSVVFDGWDCAEY